VDAKTLSAAMGNRLSLSRYEQLCPAFNAALLAAGCTTVDRVAMWCAQVGHESSGLYYMEEIADGSAYEWRSDLGNTQPGDGRKFKGHGPIQITGRFNHTKVSEWAFGRGLVPTPDYFVQRPTELGSDQYGFLGVVWYWTVARNMNSYADRSDIEGATRAVNGGTNGLADRIQRWNNCRRLGNALLPTEGDEISMAAKDDIIGFIQAYVGPIISDVKDIREQITGSRDLVKVDGKVDWKASFRGWEQLGKNDDGSNKTLVDSLADARKRIISLEDRLTKLEGK
jgi:putative chitinase